MGSRNLYIKIAIVLVIMLAFPVTILHVQAFSYPEINRRVKAVDTKPTSLKEICESVKKEWDVSPDAELKYKIEELVERLAKKGLNDLLLFNNDLITWTKLLRDTVLKEQTGRWFDLAQQLQQKVDLLIHIMEADNFEDILSSDIPDEVANVLEYFVRDAYINNFQELQLSSADIEQLIETLKAGLPFEGWLPLWLTVEPGLWLKYKIEINRAKQGAENFKQYLINMLSLNGITWVNVKYNLTKVSINRLKPTHNVNIYEGDGSASYKARLAELKKGIMVPIEVAKYMRAGEMYIADGHSRTYAAYSLGIERIEAFLFTFTDDMVDMAEKVDGSALSSVADIPMQVPEKKIGERISWKEFVEMAPKNLIEKIWSENKTQGNPTLIGVSGYFLSGRNTLVEELIKRCETFTDKIKILSLDDYFLTEKKKPVETIIDIPEQGEEITIPYTEITIGRSIGIHGEDRLYIKTVFGKQEIRIPEVGVEVKLKGYNIYITTPEEGKLLIRIPEFLARYELGRFFKDVQRLKTGKSVFVPILNPINKERLYVSVEEIDSLEEAGVEQITEGDLRLIRHPGLTGDLAEKYGDDIWINMNTGEVVWRLIPHTNIIFVTGPHALHRSEINELYDWKLFTDAMRHIRRERAIMRHILFGEHSELTIPEVIAGFEAGREQEDFIEAEQMQYTDYVIDTNYPFSEEEWDKRYGPLEERIDKAVDVAVTEGVNGYEALKYVQYCISPLNPLWNALDVIVASNLTGDKLKDFLRQNQYLLQEKAKILVDLLITFNLLPSTFRLP